MIGLVLSGYTITALVIRPFSGYMVDSFPRKIVLMVSFGAFAIFFAGYLAASTLLLLPFGTLTTANATVAIDVLPSSRRTEGIGYYGLSNNLAMALAPTIGIYVYQLTHSFEFLFWIALIVACAGWLVDATVTLPSKEIVRNKSKLSLDRFTEYGGFRFQLWCSEQLSRHLRQRGDGHHGWHGYLLLVMLYRTDRLAATGK